jgi:acetolactate synthase-1/2/3 large subunit
VVTGAADGYFRIARRPACTLLHLGPGLGNGLANLHNAKKAGSGVVNVVGDHATYHVALDAPLTSDIEGVARPMSHWVRTTPNADAVAPDAAQAIVEASTHPGRVATLILPADAAWNDLDAASRPPAPEQLAARLREVRQGTQASAAAVLESARALRAPGQTLLLLGGTALGDEGLQTAGRIAAHTGCALMSEFYVARLARGAGRVLAPRIPYVVDLAVAALARFERIVTVGAPPPVGFFAYPGKPSLLAPERAQFVELATRHDDGVAALRALADELGASAVAPAGVVAARAAGGAAPTGKPTLDGVAAVLAAAIPDNAIVIDEAVSSGRAFGAATAGAAPHDWLTAMGGSIGFGLPTAVGAAIADPSRRVLSLEGDGSGMYTPQALWTMARESLNVTVLVFANRSYRILRGELAGVGAGEPGPRAAGMLDLDRPNLDWVALARGMGVPGVRVDELSALARELGRSLAQPGPSLIELVL